MNGYEKSASSRNEDRGPCIILTFGFFLSNCRHQPRVHCAEGGKGRAMSTEAQFQLPAGGDQPCRAAKYINILTSTLYHKGILKFSSLDPGSINRQFFYEHHAILAINPIVFVPLHLLAMRSMALFYHFAASWAHFTCLRQKHPHSVNIVSQVAQTDFHSCARYSNRTQQPAPSSLGLHTKDVLNPRTDLGPGLVAFLFSGRQVAVTAPFALDVFAKTILGETLQSVCRSIGRIRPHVLARVVYKELLKNIPVVRGHIRHSIASNQPLLHFHSNVVFISVKERAVFLSPARMHIFSTLLFSRQSSGMLPSLIHFFSRLFRCFRTLTILASTICPFIAMGPLSRRCASKVANSSCTIPTLMRSSRKRQVMVMPGTFWLMCRPRKRPKDCLSRI